IYRARGWHANPTFRLVTGGLAVAAASIAIATIATPSAAIGPGASTAAWAETTDAGALVLLAVALLRAVATTAAVAAGGCGGGVVAFLPLRPGPRPALPPPVRRATHPPPPPPPRARAPPPPS